MYENIFKINLESSMYKIKYEIMATYPHVKDDKNPCFAYKGKDRLRFCQVHKDCEQRDGVCHLKSYEQMARQAGATLFDTEQPGRECISKYGKFLCYDREEEEEGPLDSISNLPQTGPLVRFFFMRQEDNAVLHTTFTYTYEAKSLRNYWKELYFRAMISMGDPESDNYTRPDKSVLYYKIPTTGGYVDSTVMKYISLMLKNAHTDKSVLTVTLRPRRNRDIIHLGTHDSTIGKAELIYDVINIDNIPKESLGLLERDDSDLVYLEGRDHAAYEEAYDIMNPHPGESEEEEESESGESERSEEEEEEEIDPVVEEQRAQERALRNAQQIQQQAFWETKIRSFHHDNENLPLIEEVFKTALHLKDDIYDNQTDVLWVILDSRGEKPELYMAYHQTLGIINVEFYSFPYNLAWNYKRQDLVKAISVIREYDLSREVLEKVLFVERILESDIENFQDDLTRNEQNVAFEVCQIYKRLITTAIDKVATDNQIPGITVANSELHTTLPHYCTKAHVFSVKRMLDLIYAECISIF